MRLICFALLAALTVGPEARAWDSPAPDVVLYCQPVLASACAALGDHFRQAQSVEVHVFSAPPDGLIGLVRHRARADVVLADMPTLRSMASGQLLRPETVTSLGADPFVLVARADAAIGKNSSAADLMASYRVVLTDPTTAASFDGSAVLLAAAKPSAAPETVGVADTASVLAEVQADRKTIGLVTATDAYAGNVSQIARLDVPPMQIGGAIVTLRQSRNADALLHFIAGPEGKRLLRENGLEAGS